MAGCTGQRIDRRVPPTGGRVAAAREAPGPAATVTPMPRRVLALLLLAATLVLGGCRFDVTAEVAVEGDGSGRLAVVVVVDEEIASRLTDHGVELAPPGVGAWQVDESSADGRREVRMTAAFADPDELGARVADLGAGLDDEDPAMLDRVELAVAEDGSAELTAVAGLRLPSSTGVQAAGLFDADDLAALAAAGDVTASLAVTFPGSVVDANADRVEGRTATWVLPVGDAITATATAGPPSPWDAGWVPAAVGIGALVLVVLVASAWLRRRRNRRSAPLGRVDSHRRSRF